MNDELLDEYASIIYNNPASLERIRDLLSELLDEALSSIGEGEWIDVKDQLPEKIKKDNILNISEPVLVISDDVVNAVPRTDYWDYNKGHWWSEACGSHWIYISVFRKYFPLPNPPSLNTK